MRQSCAPEGGFSLETKVKRITVLIIDDSALIRQLLTQVFDADADIEVVGSAADAFEARDKIKRLNPDVVTLDVEMPRMNGIQFLRNLMRLRPMPVVMISTYTQQGSDITLEALELGAIDFIGKPSLSSGRGLEAYASEICEKVKVAAKAKVGVRMPVATAPVRNPALAAYVGGRACADRTRLIVVGSSTGGTEAVKEILLQLPPDMPPILITQHIPASFSASFARRLNDICALNVKEAEDGEEILAGWVYVAPGHSHLEIAPDRVGYRCRLSDSAHVNHHRPSVDVLFRSALQHAGRNATAVILTGMGDDGARGMLEMKNQGCFTIAQDEASSVVWGMPGSAVRLGAADEVLSLDDIPKRLLAKIKGK